MIRRWFALPLVVVACGPGPGREVIPRLPGDGTGEWPKLVRFMEMLQTHRPPFWVRTASLSREGAATSPQNARLTLQLEAPLAPGKAQP
jgi:general secretion pathway protein M